VASLFSHVRFPLLTHSFIRDVVHEEPLLASGPGMRVVSRALLTIPGEASVLSVARDGLGPRMLYAIGGVGGAGADEDPLGVVERFDVMAGKWEAMAPMLTKRDAMGVGVVGGKLYAVGGYGRGGLHTNTCERFDPLTNTWEAMAPMPSKRSGMGVGVVGGKLYAVGGYGSGGIVQACERFDPQTNTWEAAAPMPTARWGMGFSAM